MHISRLATVIFAAALLGSISAYAQDGEIATIADENGCKVYNPMPQEEESIRWNGEHESRHSSTCADAKRIAKKLAATVRRRLHQP
jgi:hypothetical protein